MDYDALWKAVWQGRYHAEFNSDYHLMAANAWGEWGSYSALATACVLLVAGIVTACRRAGKVDLSDFVVWCVSLVTLLSCAAVVSYCEYSRSVHDTFYREWTNLAQEWQAVEDQFASTPETNSAMHIGRLREVLRNIEAREPTSYDYDMMGEAQKRTDKRMGVVRDANGVGKVQ